MTFRTPSSSARMKVFFGLRTPGCCTLVCCPCSFLWESIADIIRFSLFLHCVLHVAMVVERKPVKRKVVGATASEGERQNVGRRRASSKTDPQWKDPWLTPAESCCWMKHGKMRTSPHGPQLPCRIPLTKNVKRRDSRLEVNGCQSGVTANAEPPAPEVQTNEGHEAVGGDHSQRSLRQAEGPDVLSWNAGLKKGKVT